MSTSLTQTCRFPAGRWKDVLLRKSLLCPAYLLPRLYENSLTLFTIVSAQTTEPPAQVLTALDHRTCLMGMDVVRAACQHLPPRTLHLSGSVQLSRLPEDFLPPSLDLLSPWVLAWDEVPSQKAGEGPWPRTCPTYLPREADSTGTTWPFFSREASTLFQQQKSRTSWVKWISRRSCGPSGKSHVQKEES